MRLIALLLSGEVGEAVLRQSGQSVVVETQLCQCRQSTDRACNVRQRSVDDSQRPKMTVRQITGQQ